ncbi:TauD/TfdA family dioxygenase [Mesorhizobium delmotii]|uniref:TauD/TfdA-like domain-containing protein n=1 Tax=Mesorhizobium delmotii TaxID=1631247 RepID=A0A2P9ANP1_9HYPH|nr:TauD/TfdA family dioxygenase [Mesorhizobium delmotii]SJM32767.1 hypothetical protein BQ8482_310088 [Mesorhizobium delmotii]
MRKFDCHCGVGRSETGENLWHKEMRVGFGSPKADRTVRAPRAQGREYFVIQLQQHPRTLYQKSTALKAGEMAVFDNRRVLHGRQSFNPNTGLRHLRRCYVDRGEFQSRIRVLSR